ncbi:MAG: ATP-binding protein [Luteitalea sp.]|nr:ATP-binding protein [Luteitalea sp.]
MGSIEQTFLLQVPSSTENLAMIRDFVASVGEQAGLGEEDVSKLELAVDEACANAIEHAHGNDLTKAVTVRATFDQQSLRIEVVDAGGGFDLGAVPDESLARLTAAGRMGGLGVRVMRALVDEVSYEIVPGEPNRLRLLKHIRR